MESGVSAEIHFAQKLASNEKKIRDRAIKRLKKYLAVRSTHENGLNESDMLKIWKGLFYCMWMQDKPLIQEELSQRIANLVHSFPKATDSLRFVSVFLETQSREWNGIDKLRLDKFMMMIRDLLHQSFLLLSNDDWPESDCKTFAFSIYEHVMNPHKSNLPDGLKLHLADIFLEELKTVSLEKLTSKTLVILLQPFIEFILFTNKLELATRVLSEVIYKVLKGVSASDKASKEKQKVDASDEINKEDSEEMEVEESDQQPEENVFQLEKGFLLKRMFEMAGRKDIRASNRAMIYGLVKRYPEHFNNNNCPNSSEQTVDVPINDPPFCCDIRFLKDGGKAVDQQQVEQKKRNRKRRKKNKDVESNNVGEISSSVNTVETDFEKMKKKAKLKKKKEQFGNDENASSVVHDSEPITKRPSLNVSAKKKNKSINLKNSVTGLSTHAPVLGDIKGLGNKLTSKKFSDKLISSDNFLGDSANVKVVSRKRKYESDDTENSPSKKKIKSNIFESRELVVKQDTPKKKKRDSSIDISLPTGENLSNVETVVKSTEKDVNANAKPKYKSTSPLKSKKPCIKVELVKYGHTAPISSLFEQAFAESKERAVSHSPRRKQLQSGVSDASSDSENIEASQTSTLKPEDQPASSKNKQEINSQGVTYTRAVPYQNEQESSSLSATFVSPKVRSKSASPKTPKYSTPSKELLSASCNVEKKDLSTLREEDKETPPGMSCGSKKKVIFDLRRNKANKFQDYLKSLAKQPDSPYQPSKSPVVGILKSPCNSPVLSSSCTEIGSSDSKLTPHYKIEKRHRRRASAPGSLINSTSTRKKIRSIYKSSINMISSNIQKTISQMQMISGFSLPKIT